MGVNTRYLRSGLGAQVRSPFGAKVCRASRFLEITSWPSVVRDGETYVLIGDLFGDTQGTGSVRICNRNDCSLLSQTQTIVSWSDTEIVFTADLDSGALEDSLIYINVTNDDSDSTAVASTSELILGEITIDLVKVGVDISDRIPAAAAAACGISTGEYCGMRVIERTEGMVFHQLAIFGYSLSPTEDTFFKNTPGFYIEGATSGKKIELGYRDHYDFGYPDDNASEWCNGDGGFPVFVRPNSRPSFADEETFIILYALGSCSGTYGWTEGETVYLSPKYPVSLFYQSEFSYPQSVKPSITFGIDAFAFAAEGDISTSIEWYEPNYGPGNLIDTGSTLTITTGATVPDTLTYDLRVVNAGGQDRFVPGGLTLYVNDMEITEIFPQGGDDSGGAVVYIFGTSFESDAAVEFGGVPATGEIFVSTYWLKCTAPAGAGTVDIDVTDSNGTVNLPSAFTYDSIENITVTAVSPGSGDVYGGETITVSGTGFTADCLVYFVYIYPGGPGAAYFEYYIEAASTTFNSFIELQAETPDFSDDPGNLFLASILVVDTVTLAGGILEDAFDVIGEL